jgi:Uma2 family endonuclease
MTVEEFLDFAESSEEGYEYIDGEPVKMTGGKLNHFDISANIVAACMSLVANRDCRVLGGGMLVRVGETRLVAPDASVVCGVPETEADTRILLNPVLVVEVTSPTSIDYDRVSKRQYYGNVPSIRAYLIIDQHRRLAELYTRSESGWHLRTFTEPDDDIPLEALDCSLPLRDIYQRIEFADEPPPTAAEGA